MAESAPPGTGKILGQKIIFLKVTTLGQNRQFGGVVKLTDRAGKYLWKVALARTLHVQIQEGPAYYFFVLFVPPLSCPPN